jgi:hypothetical protein
MTEQVREQKKKPHRQCLKDSGEVKVLGEVTNIVIIQGESSIAWKCVVNVELLS